jgi:hypothetical protein
MNYKHKLSEITSKRGYCSFCARVVRVKRNSNGSLVCAAKSTSGKGRRKRGGKYRNKPWRLVIQDDSVCSRCGFIPEHRVQLDVNHKNGNRYDNRPENWEILCANCHRLETYVSEHYANKYVGDGTNRPDYIPWAQMEEAIPPKDGQPPLFN